MEGENPEFALGKGYYWVGSRALADNLQCNPYLLVEGDEAVVFDPGSTLDASEVMHNIATIVPLEKVRYVVLHHQDPDLASAVPVMEAAGMKFTVVTHWRTWSLVRYYGVKSPVYLVDEHGYSLGLAGGRRLQFIPTPYLHFPGAVATYDKGAKYLLSSDLFGAFAARWSLYADDGYLEGMKAFHEHYMPSNDILRPVMEFFLGLDIDMILPQHGSIIAKDVRRHILALRDLECGAMMRPIKKDLAASGGYQTPAEELLVRIGALFGDGARDAVVGRLGISYDPAARRIVDFGVTGEALWNGLAEAIYLEKGMSSLTVLEPLVSRLCTEFSISKPAIYMGALSDAEKASAALAGEVDRLTRMMTELNQTVSQTKDSFLRDAVTGLYTEAFFRSFIDEQVAMLFDEGGVEDDSLAVFGIDEGMATIELHYGPKEVEEILRGVARILRDTKSATQPAFRLYGATFALWLPRLEFHEALKICEAIRKKVQSSKAFIEPITVSAGIVAVAEIRRESADPSIAGNALVDVGIRRLRLAKKRGGDTICTSSDLSVADNAKARILVVDDDPVNSDVLKTFLENASYSVSLAEDGAEALEKIVKEGYDLVISELMVPKMDAFALKEAMSHRSGTKDIPFVLLSHLKDEKTVVRAGGLGIIHYLRKPYMMAEVLGIVENLVAGGESR
ncbi:MAG: response regulator [Rectinemataceae bacterium]